MRSYTAGRNQYGVWAKNTSTAGLTDGDNVANNLYRHICAMKDWPFLEKLRTVTTTASTQFTTLPYDCDQVREISVIPVSQTIRYTPQLSPSKKHWDELNLVTFTSDIPQWYFIYQGQVGLWPTPASTGNTIYVNQKTRVIDLSIADYTSGTITAVTNGATTVTGSGTTWTAQMVGRYIQIAYSNTANTGDGIWYEISAVASATSLTLTRAYGSTSIAAGGAAYIIGQMPLLPEAFHDTPWKGAAAQYWKKEVDERGETFQKDYDIDIKDLIRTYSSATTDMVIDNGEDFNIINPNLTVRL